MAYIYITNQYFANSQQISNKALFGASDLEIESFTLTKRDTESVFRIMKRVYKFLDDWKASHSAAPILLSVDSETAKVVNSYFYEMSDSEYEHFSIKDGEVRRYCC
ncbi:MAG: hypothetical protein Q4F83_05745 [Eubacteriales bacterium]|nr:hypothetical protein [Eubacteriales bacterium]